MDESIKKRKKNRKRRECPSGKSRSDWKNGGTTLTEINLYNLFLKMHIHRHSNTLGGSFCFWVTLPCLGDTHFTLSLDAWCPIKSYSEAVSKMLLGGKTFVRWQKEKKPPVASFHREPVSRLGECTWWLFLWRLTNTATLSTVICTDMHTFVAILLSSLRGSRCNAKLCVTVL